MYNFCLFVVMAKFGISYSTITVSTFLAYDGQLWLVSGDAHSIIYDG